MRRPRFSEMLFTRRQQLGLTTSQASRILRLREDVLIAFEKGDFEKMPQSGYAQGMLSSYARYLGLNPRQVTDLFQEELHEHVNGSGSHELRRRTRDAQTGRVVSGYEAANEPGSKPKAYGEYHALLPDSGGPAGDMGAFATTTSARPRHSMPLAGSGPSAAGAYENKTFGSASRSGMRQRRPYNGDSAGRGRDQGSRDSRPDRRRRRDMQQRRGRDGSAADRTFKERRGTYRHDDVSARNIVSREYTDDMRLDETTNLYGRSSTISERRSSRNIANMERPSARRNGSSGRSASRGGRQQGRQSDSRRRRGAGFFSDPRRAVFGIVLILAVVITPILVFAVSSRANNSPVAKSVSVTDANSGSTTTTSSSVPTSSNGPGSSDTSKSTSSSGSASSTTSSDTSASGTSASTYTPTVVKVSVASGAYTWLEITSDGVSDIAESITGPWEREYTVSDSITVQAGDPSSVSVTNNGASVSFTSKASGLGSLSIKGTKPPKTTTEQSENGSADGSKSDSGDDQSADESYSEGY